jgi:hypothetical protein
MVIGPAALSTKDYKDPSKLRNRMPDKFLKTRSNREASMAPF